jgi:hypothetical protein
VLSLGSYLLGAAQLAVAALSLGFSAYRLRQRLLPAWEGAPARLAEATAAVAFLLWISEILGTFGLLYAGTLVALSALLARPRGSFSYRRGWGVPCGDRTRRLGVARVPVDHGGRHRLGVRALGADD